MKRLEQVRLEVDSRRHTVNALNDAITAKQKKQPKNAPPSQSSQRLETQIELTIRRMQHKENKLAGAALPPLDPARAAWAVSTFRPSHDAMVWDCRVPR